MKIVFKSKALNITLELSGIFKKSENLISESFFDRESFTHSFVDIVLYYFNPLKCVKHNYWF